MYHIHCAKGDVGRYVLLPGDPFRTDLMASYLDNPVLVAHNREHKTWTGTLLGEKVTITSTGMGCPSTAIALEELIACGADTFIRVGTAGCMCPKLRKPEASGGIVTAAIRDEGTTRQYVPLEYPAVADRCVVGALADAAKKLGYCFDEGITYTKDGLYPLLSPESVPLGDERKDYLKTWEKAGVLLTEMEAAAVLVISSLRGCRASGIMAYSDAADPAAEIDRAIQVACEAIRNLIREDRKAEGKQNAPKLVLCDVDGTLFDRKDTMQPGHGKLQKILSSSKIPFTLASGRCLDNMKHLIEYLDIKLPVIVNNGTAILQDGKVLWEEKLCALDLREAVEMADRMGMFVSFYGAVEERVYRHNDYVQSYIDRFGKSYTYVLGENEQADDALWNALSVQKILIIDPDTTGRIDEIIGKIKNVEDKSIVKYDQRSIDVMPRSCTKEKGAQILSEIMGVPMKDIMAIGDNENDIEMIREVGIGAAVANGTNRLKNVADYVAESTGVDGVVEAIEKYFHLPEAQL